MRSNNIECDEGDPIILDDNSIRCDRNNNDYTGLVKIPVDPAGDCCYGSSTKPCKSEGSQEHRHNAQ